MSPCRPACWAMVDTCCRCRWRLPRRWPSFRCAAAIEGRASRAAGSADPRRDPQHGADLGVSQRPCAGAQSSSRPCPTVARGSTGAAAARFYDLRCGSGSAQWRFISARCWSDQSALEPARRGAGDVRVIASAASRRPAASAGPRLRFLHRFRPRCAVSACPRRRRVRSRARPMLAGCRLCRTLRLSSLAVMNLPHIASCSPLSRVTFRTGLPLGLFAALACCRPAALNAAPAERARVVARASQPGHRAAASQAFVLSCVLIERGATVEWRNLTPPHTALSVLSPREPYELSSPALLRRTTGSAPTSPASAPARAAAPARAGALRLLAPAPLPRSASSTIATAAARWSKAAAPIAMAYRPGHDDQKRGHRHRLRAQQPHRQRGAHRSVAVRTATAPEGITCLGGLWGGEVMSPSKTKRSGVRQPRSRAPWIVSVCSWLLVFCLRLVAALMPRGSPSRCRSRPMGGSWRWSTPTPTRCRLSIPRPARCAADRARPTTAADRRWPLRATLAPRSVDLSADGRLAYVACQASGQLLTVEVESGACSRRCGWGRAGGRAAPWRWARALRQPVSERRGGTPTPGFRRPPRRGGDAEAAAPDRPWGLALDERRRSAPGLALPAEPRHPGAWMPRPWHRSAGRRSPRSPAGQPPAGQWSAARTLQPGGAPDPRI